MHESWTSTTFARFAGNVIIRTTTVANKNLNVFPVPIVNSKSPRVGAARISAALVISTREQKPGRAFFGAANKFPGRARPRAFRGHYSRIAIVQGRRIRVGGRRSRTIFGQTESRALDLPRTWYSRDRRRPPLLLPSPLAEMENILAGSIV